MKRTRVLIMGAAGRDFHNFNLVFRDNPQYEVVAFTAAQIPNIEGRRYPPELAGELYPDGVPIYPEEDLERLIEEHAIDQVVFSYSDVSHEHVMHAAARALARGADFRLLGARATMLRANRPVISVCAVRTGCGKSPASRKIARLLREMGRRVVVVRHPMPYGDLSQQVVQRFETLDDLRRYNCTIEEMEEYEPHLRNGVIVYAGVDYARIVRQAEAEADVLIWDGGNNDLPFFVPDLEIVLVDPHRPGHERAYFPGEVNFLRADVLIISKVNTARPEDVDVVRRNIRTFNPNALVIEANLPIVVDTPEAIRDRRVLVVEDGPTLTHGEMSYGAGVLAARQFGARELVDPRPYAVGSIRETFAEYPHIGPLLPAMGYGAEQMRELEETINGTPCEVVLVATPVDLRRVLQIRHPTCRVAYELEEVGPPTLGDVLRDFLTTVNA
ncbi:MAG TPA: cyclic 2,3-diphosphoglycerate synthase [Blastocatellia bacterium]|nr:cyclic 2,3-diphosphoglycerate synthase [Blastocatellia bacterium]